MERNISTPPPSERHPPPVVRMNAAIHPTSGAPTRWADIDENDNTLPPLPPNLKRAISCPTNEENKNKIKNKKQARESR